MAPPPAPAKPPSTRTFLIALGVVLGLASLTIVGYGLVDAWDALPIAFLLLFGTLAIGALLGFLFGIPRTAHAGAPGAPAPVQYWSNDNLEQISDWLTKILVGVGLVELGRLSSSAGALLDWVAPALGAPGVAAARPFTLGLLVYGVVAGFLFGYLMTRLRLQGLMYRAEAEMRVVAEEQAKTVARLGRPKAAHEHPPSVSRAG